MDFDGIEFQVLNHLVHSDDYVRKTLPFLKAEYFGNETEKTIFKLISDFIAKYNKPPEIETLKIDLENVKALSENTHDEGVKLLNAFREPKKLNIDWMVDRTEKFCQEKAIYNSVIEAINILDGKSKLDKGAIPELLTNALAVNFDNRIGHDFIEDFEKRFEFYHDIKKRIPFDIDMFNKATRGGLPDKTLNVILAPTGVGKTLVMAHMAAANLVAGKNVLYITLEMSEEKIAERIDANLLDVDVQELEKIPKDSYFAKVHRLKQKTMGKLIIKEYPTGSAGAGHFRHLLNELWLKKKFKPDIIYIDYLNICCSMKIKGGNTDSYGYIKSISEELRGLAVEKVVPIVTATQTNRNGLDNSDISMADISESFGGPMTFDWLVALISTEELAAQNQILVKQLKTRYNGLDNYKKFLIGVDKSKMRLYNLEESAQSMTKTPEPEKKKKGKKIDNVDDDGVVFDNTNINKEKSSDDFVWKKGTGSKFL